MQFKSVGAENHRRLHCTTHGTSILKSSTMLKIFLLLLDNCSWRHSFMIDESTCTDPIRAEHNGHYAFLQVLFLFPIKYLSSCQGFFCVDPHACSEFGRCPIFFILPPSDLVHKGHSIGKDCFWLNISFSVSRVRSKGSVVYEDFPIFFQCVFSQLHCSWVVFTFNPRSRWGLFHLMFPAFPCVRDLTGFPITSPGASSQKHPSWAPSLGASPRFEAGPSGSAPGSLMEQIRHNAHQQEKKEAQGGIRQTRWNFIQEKGHDSWHGWRLRSPFIARPTAARELSPPVRNTPSGCELHRRLCCMSTRLHCWLCLWILVPLFTNLLLRFVGAEIHSKAHWRGHGTAMSLCSASKMRFYFVVTFGSVIHSWSHKKSSVTQLTLSMIIASIGCKSKGWSLLRPSHRTALVFIHMDAARYDPTHLLLSILLPCPLLPSHRRRWPSALPRTVAAHTVPCLHRNHTCQICGHSKICSALKLLNTWHEGSYHGTARSCHVNIPSDLSSPSTFQRHERLANGR